MDKTIITIKGLSVKNYKRDEDAFDLHIFLEINDQKKILAKRYNYGKSENIISDAIQVIKSKFRSYDYLEENPLEQGMIIMRNLEDVEEKMVMFVKRVHDTIRDFKQHKSHVNYTNLYNSIDGLSANF